VQFGVVDAQRHEPDALGLLAADRLAQQQVVLRLGHAAQQRPYDRRMVAGRDAEAGVAVDDAGGTAGDRDVGEQARHEAGADGRALHRRDDGLGAVDQVVDEVARLLPHAAERVEVLGHLLHEVEIATRGEGLAGAADDRRGDGFGHQRLKIIDLTEKAQQPMVDSDLGLTIVFNGCIYNYPELRAELAARLHVLLARRHRGDPEGLARLGAGLRQALPRHVRLRHRRARQRPGVLARDRFGIKPLYYSQSNGTPALRLQPAGAGGGRRRRHDDRSGGAAHYMSFHAVVPPPHTILRGVKKLPPATMRIIEADGAQRDVTYWTLDFTRSAADIETPYEEWRDRVLEALRKAVERRMVADVPVGVLLSGGVDSSIIVGLLAEAGQHGLMTFSIGFEEAHGEKGDEFVYSDLIAERFETDHHKIFMPSARLMDALPDTIAAMSEPMVSYDNVGFFLLSPEVAKHIKVVQSGQGADEVFGGYHWYPPLAASNDPGRRLCPRVLRPQPRESRAGSCRPNGCRDGREPGARRRSLRPPGRGDAVDKALRLDSQVMLVDDPVKRVDNMTMAWGSRRACRSSTTNWSSSPRASRPSTSCATAARAS
jgi:asparagine synthase (glutamine-hydrolysing)